MRSTYFLPRDINPYITPVVKIKPLPNMICSSWQRNTAGRAILKNHKHTKKKKWIN